MLTIIIIPFYTLKPSIVFGTQQMPQCLLKRMNEGVSHGNSWMKRIQAKGKGGTVALELMLPVEKRLTSISRKRSLEVFSWKLRAKRDSCLEEGQSHLPSVVNAGNGAKILPRRWFRINIDRKTHEPLKPIALFQ